jgi:septum site-determining protein MinD
MGKTLIVTSGRGGSGKSTLSIEFARFLSARKIRTAVLDMSFGHRDLDLLLGVEEQVVFDTGDVLSGISEINDIAIKVEDNFDYYPASQNISKLMKSVNRLPWLLAELKNMYHLTIVDISFEMLVALGRAFERSDFSVVIARADDAGMRSAESANEILARLNLTKKFYVLDGPPGEYAARLSLNSDGVLGERGSGYEELTNRFLEEIGK